MCYLVVTTARREEERRVRGAELRMLQEQKVSWLDIYSIYSIYNV